MVELVKINIDINNKIQEFNNKINNTNFNNSKENIINDLELIRKEINILLNDYEEKIINVMYENNLYDEKKIYNILKSLDNLSYDIFSKIIKIKKKYVI